MHRRGSILALGVALQLLVSVPVHASPVTLSFTAHTDTVCRPAPPGSVAPALTCGPEARTVAVTLTYDPATLVTEVTSTGEVEMSLAPLTYTVSLPILENPWDGSVVSYSSARASFGDPVVTPRHTGGFLISDTFGPERTGGPTEPKVTRFWTTAIEFGSSEKGAILEPTLADFDALLTGAVHGDVAFEFATYAWETIDNLDGTRTAFYLPESRTYSGRYHVPEPSVTILALAGGAAEWLRRRRSPRIWKRSADC